MTPREKAERAKQLLEDPMFRHVLSDLRMSIVDRLEAMPLGSVDDQHEGVLMLQLLKSIPERLQRYVADELIDKDKTRTDSFIERMRESLMKSVP